jgi:hypothetical protein
LNQNLYFEIASIVHPEMVLFFLIDVLCGFPAAAYRHTPSCPALRGLQTLACPAIALFQAEADAALRLRQGFDGTSDQNKNCSF